MKKLFLIPLLFSACATFARDNAGHILKLYTADMLRITSKERSAQKQTSATASRRTATVFYLHDGVSTLYVGDSTSYDYSSGRGYDMRTDEWQFDNSVLATSNQQPYQNTTKESRKYDSRNNLTEAIIYSWDNGTWEESRKTITSYTSNNMPDISTQYWFTGAVWKPTQRYTSTYTNAGKESIMLEERNDNNVWVTESRITTTYNSGNMPVTYIEERCVAGVWENDYKFTLSYNGNKVTNDVTEAWENNKWVNYSKNIYQYNTTGLKKDETYYLWDQNSPSWTESGKTLYTYDSRGNLVEQENVRGAKQTWQYNSYNQHTVNSQKTWDANAQDYIFQKCDHQYRYYYEEYTGIAKTPSLVKAMLYPVPAGKYLNIEIPFNTATNFSLIITDMNGRVVRSWNEKATGSYTSSKNIEDLPAGDYILTTNDGSSAASEKFTHTK